jgi:hypothetical protein
LRLHIVYGFVPDGKMSMVDEIVSAIAYFQAPPLIFPKKLMKPMRDFTQVACVGPK